MAKSHDENNLTPSAKLAALIQKNRNIILLVAAVLLIALIIIGVTSYVQEQKARKGALAVESLQEIYAEWQNETDEDKKTILEDELTETISDTIASFKGTMAEQRGHLMAGSIAFEKTDWEKALSSFQTIAKRFPKSYLAPVALMNQGAVYEEMGKNREALEVYQAITDSYTGITPEVPHAHFSIARLYELTGQDESAIEAYRELSESFPESDWTKLARDRIIYLETR
jgi:TolA-binding protein